MENFKNNTFKIFGLIGITLIFPTTYFLTAVFLKYGLGVDFLFNLIDRPSFRFITDFAVIIFPFIALLLNIIPLLDINVKVEAGNLVSRLAIKLKPLNIIVCILSLGYMMVIFAYGISENLMIREHSLNVNETLNQLMRII